MTDNERIQLHGIVSNPGYMVLIGLFEQEELAMRDDMLNADPANPPAVLAAQAAAQGFSRGFQRVRAAIQAEMSNLLDKPQEPTSEELELSQILNP